MKKQKKDPIDNLDNVDVYFAPRTISKEEEIALSIFFRDLKKAKTKRKRAA
jgi:hypothetical protein